MNVSRRWFIGGAASLGAFQGCRFLPSIGGSNGVARLKFGVVSDIHILAENTDRGHQGNTRTFRRALRWFDAQGVDGVVIAGDMADAGLVSQLQCVADAWNAVFPGGRSRLDGRSVEKLFVYGNHDWEGQFYNYKIFGRDSRDLEADHIRVNGMKKVWEEVFEEAYEPIWMKTVKGYSFVGAHWDPTNGSDWGKGPDIAPFFRQHGEAIDPALPFFYIQHPHPKDTCYGSWAWGHDDGRSTRTLSQYANAIAFSGHSHYSLLDERTLWQGAFTSIGTGSLRYAGEAYDEFAAEGGYENTGGGDAKARKSAEGKLMERTKNALERNGLLVSVYDDRITIVRRDFRYDCDLGPDWTMPLPVAEAKPFAFAEHARHFTAPQFAAGAAVKVAWEKREVGGKAKKRSVDTVRVSVPGAVQTVANRVWRYDVSIETEDGKTVLKRRVLSPDFHLPLGKIPADFAFVAPKADLPSGVSFRFKIVPFNCFGRAGKPIFSESVKRREE